MLGALTLPALLAAAQLWAAETSLGMKLDGEIEHSFIVSPDGRHIAYAIAKDGKEFVVVDGKMGKGYAKLPRWRLTEAGIKPQIIFSPTGDRVGYVAMADDKHSMVVVNGVEGPVYDYVAPGAPRFSPDGKRIAYVARQANKDYPVIDGVEGAAFDSIYTPPRLFSQDSRHTLFEANRNGKNLIVFDGKEIPKNDFHGDPAFSLQGGRTAETVLVGDKWVVYIDGKPGKPYDSIGNSILFSPDYKHVLYQARDKGGDFLVVDGVEGKRFPAIAEATYKFAPDGLHYGFAVRLFKQAYVVVNDVKGEDFDWVSEPAFSWDGLSLAYMAEKGGKRFIVQDGKRGPSFDQIDITPSYALTSRRLIYTASLGGKHYLVVDGRATPYDEIYDAEFSLDGKKVICTARTGKEWAVYVDAVKSKPSESPYMSPLFSADGKHSAYLVERQKKITVVLDGLEFGPYEEIGFVQFSPKDSRLLYTAKRNGKWVIVANGIATKEYDSFVFNGLPEFQADGSLAMLAMRSNEYLRVVIPGRN